MSRRKRNSAVALNCLRDYLAPCSLDNQEMELLVHVAVTCFISVHQMSLGKNRVPFPETLLQRMEEAARRALFGQHPRGKAFKHPTNVNGVHDLLRGEGPDNKATRVQLGEHALLREDRQRLANGSPGNSELAGKLHFTD